jgi:hypothetical protein
MMVRRIMAWWRYWLLLWMMRHEESEWRALGLPKDHVVVVEVEVLVE